MTSHFFLCRHHHHESSNYHHHHHHHRNRHYHHHHRNPPLVLVIVNAIIAVTKGYWPLITCHFHFSRPRPCLLLTEYGQDLPLFFVGIVHRERQKIEMQDPQNSDTLLQDVGGLSWYHLSFFITDSPFLLVKIFIFVAKFITRVA